MSMESVFQRKKINDGLPVFPTYMQFKVRGILQQPMDMQSYTYSKLGRGNDVSHMSSGISVYRRY